MRLRLLFGFLITCIVSIPARAQDNPRLELFGGYSHAGVEGTGLNGWTVALAKGIAPSISLVAEGTGHYSSIDVPTFGTSGSFSAKGNIHSFRAGPRYVVRTSHENLTPFVHALAGYGKAHATAGYKGLESLGLGSVEDSITGLSMAFGGGLDLRAGSMTFRVLQLDYQTLHGKGDSTGGVRLSLGVVLKRK
jgi:hypothetical protein